VKVGVVHSFYRSENPSGENEAVLHQTQALRDAGLEVAEYFRRSDEALRRPLFKMRAAARVATGLDFQHPLDWVRREQPDILHVHNLFPNFGSRWLSRTGIPVVSTLHNFRFACANGLLYRDGTVCTACPDSGSSNALRFRCYRDSVTSTLPLAVSTRGGVHGNLQLRGSDVIVTQSQRVTRFLLEHGIDHVKVREVPGFIEIPAQFSRLSPATSRFVFVGRDSAEKGLSELLHIWPPEQELDVIGADSDSRARTSSARVRFLGVRDRHWILKTLPQYSALVFPGRVWEGAYPLVVREALAVGLPVVALDGSGAADLVRESGGGCTYVDGNGPSLLAALDRALEAGTGLRSRARAFAEAALGQDAWTHKIIGAFRAAADLHHQRQP
jgi:glycosyltransferase involved in cell wall biosynthesis